MKHSFLRSVLLSAITLLTPILLVLGAVRMMLTPLFMQTEYKLPNFPADKYGFSLEERRYG